MPAGAVAGTVKLPVVGSNVEPTVAGVNTVIVVLVVVAGLAPTVSLVSTLTEPAVPNGVLALSLTASITAIVALVVLLPATPSLVALVAPFTPTLVCAVSVPPTVPGIVTVNGQVMVPFGSTLAALLPALNTQAPVVTVAPAGVPAAAVQVAFVAAVTVERLVHTTLTVAPERTAPGAAVAGRPVIATRMSEGVSLTTIVLVQRAGNGATHKGSPLVTVAVLDTLALLVLVTFSVTTFETAAAGASPVALTQLMVAGPVAVVGVQVHPTPFARLVNVTPAGSAS